MDRSKFFRHCDPRHPEGFFGRLAILLLLELLLLYSLNSILTMSYFVVSISNDGGAPEQAYRKMQSAGACPEAPFAGEFFGVSMEL